MRQATRPRPLQLAAALALLVGACHRPYGRLQYAALDSPAEGRAVPYGLYTPPGWDGRTPLPLVLLLHGAGDDQTSADRKVVVEALDRAVRGGELPPFLMVTPQGGRSFWVDWSDGTHHMRDFLLHELVPSLRARYPIVPGPAGLHLMGVSMGAGGGMQVWLSARAELGSASLLSAPILPEAETRAFLTRFTSPEVVSRVFGPPGKSQGIDPYVALSDAGSLSGSRLLFGAAHHDRDGILAATRQFHTTLSERGVPHAFVAFPGRHAWTTWAGVFPYALCQQLGSPCRMSPPAGSEVSSP
jgi:enterochelin esterase-like enzyme